MISRRHVLAAGASAASVAAVPVLAQTPALAKLKFTLDWARQGPNAYADMGKEKGFFRDVGIDITIDRGFGSGRVPTDIAAGTYDMGQGVPIDPSTELANGTRVAGPSALRQSIVARPTDGPPSSNARAIGFAFCVAAVASAAVVLSKESSY